MMGGCDVRWSRKAPRLVEWTDIQTEHQLATLGRGAGAPMEYGVQGVHAVVQGGRTRCYFHSSLPGSHSLHYALHDGELHVNTYAWPLIRRLKALGVARPKVELAQAGVVHVFNGDGLKTYPGDRWDPPAIEEGMTLEEAGPRLFEALCEAAEDIYTRLGKPPVVAQLSAGTDSALTVAALKAIGANVSTVCVGRDATDFDPLWAARYAEDLGVPHHLVPLPDTDSGLVSLLEHTLTLIERHDYSNVLMGMCTRLTLDFALSQRAPIVFHGHFGDDLVGTEMLVWGQYRKYHPVTDSVSWRDWRAKESLYLFPNTVQIDKVSRAFNLSWRCLFSHPLVVRFLMSCPLAVLPLGGKKVLYWQALKPHLPRTAWPEHKKVGYYTGSGIGKIRLTNPLLSDAAIRAAYQRLKP